MDDGGTSPSAPSQDSYVDENVDLDRNDVFYADLAEPFNDRTLTRGDAYMMILDLAVKYGFS